MFNVNYLAQIMRSIENFHFVYTLCYNDAIFYVGCCKDVVKRYSQHIGKNGNIPYIKDILQIGHFPKLHIITFVPFEEALSIEETMIKVISSGGQKLYNTNHYRPNNKPSQLTKKEIRKSLAKEQEDLKEIAKGYRGYYQPSIRKVQRS